MIRQFGPTEAWFIIAAVRWTLLLSAIAFIGGGIAGLGVALARTAPVAWLRLAATGYIELFQGTPLLMQLFLVFFGSAMLGSGVDPWSPRRSPDALCRARFSARSGAAASRRSPPANGRRPPRSACATRPHALRDPAAGLRIAIAPTVGFLVQLVKGTSLASIIGLSNT